MYCRLCRPRGTPFCDVKGCWERSTEVHDCWHGLGHSRVSHDKVWSIGHHSSVGTAFCALEVFTGGGYIMKEYLSTLFVSLKHNYLLIRLI